jgi:Fic family protein
MQMTPDHDDDPERRYTPAEEHLLTQHLRALVERVRLVDSRRSLYSTHLICSWHMQLFGGVRAHAGRMRSRDYGEEYLVFGPHRSANRADVEQLMFQHVDKSLQINDRQQGEPVNIIRFALLAHVEFIKIHPFRDGNGRIGRLILSYWLRRNELPPLIFEGAKDDYINSLNIYYATRDEGPLLRLALNLYGRLFAEMDS